MTKSDLKTGMLVQYRNQEVYMVVNRALIAANGDFMDLLSSNFDLLHKEVWSNSKWDIMKVSNVLSNGMLPPNNWNEKVLNEKLLWARDSTPEYTMDEAISKMGHEFKIKK